MLEDDHRRYSPPRGPDRPPQETSARACCSNEWQTFLGLVPTTKYVLLAGGREKLIVGGEYINKLNCRERSHRQGARRGTRLLLSRDWTD